MSTKINAGKVWNLPASGFPDRATTYWDIVANAGLASHPLDILEIGVYRAGLLSGLLKRTDIQVKSYTGIDPYLGDERDSYTGAYWKNAGESNSIYVDAKRIFDKAGYDLLRCCSHEFYSENSTRTWDLIIIDGDHRKPAALWDLHHWFKRLKPRSIIIGDDYANSDTPEVTHAVNGFIRLNKQNISRSGYRVLPFQNKGKEIPISLTIVYFMKSPDPNETKSWSYQFAAKQQFHPIRRVLRYFGFDIRRV